MSARKLPRSHGGYHRFLALLIGMVVFFDGYDTFNPAYVIHYVTKAVASGAEPGRALVSSGLIGFHDRVRSYKENSPIGMGGGRRCLRRFERDDFFQLCHSGPGTFVRHVLHPAIIDRAWHGRTPAARRDLRSTNIRPAVLANTFSMWGWALGWAAGGVVAAAIGIYLHPDVRLAALYYAASLSIVLVLVCHLALPSRCNFRLCAAIGRNYRVLCRLILRKLAV